MVLKIEPLRKPHFNCIDGILATVAEFFNRPHEMMFAGCMGFGYDAAQNTFGKSLNVGIKNWSREMLLKYHGIKARWNEIKSYAVLHDLIIDTIDLGCPIGVYVDSFYCSTSPDYKKFHNNHYVLIIGYDEEAQGYHYVDPIFSAKKNVLPFYNLKRGFKEYIIFEKLENPIKNINLEDVSSDFNGIEVIENMYDMTINFAEDFKAKFNLNAEIAEYNNELKHSLMFRKIDSIAQNRLKFSLSLRFLAEHFKNEDLKNVSKEIEKTRTEWEFMNMLLFKFHFTKNEKIKDKIYCLIKTIADKELVVQSEILEVINHEHEEN